MTQPPDWSFSGERGPANWGALSPAYAKCASGRRQSPVDLAQAIPGRRGDLAVSYHFNRLTFVDLFWTLSVLATPGGLMSYRGVQHDLVELHFHAPADHPIGHRQSDLEAHFVHMAADRSLAVVGVLFEADAGSHPVDELITAIPVEPGGTHTFDRLRDIQRMIPLSSKRYRYEGSRTTPPCNEEVSWVIMDEPRGVGREALAVFTERYPPNNRPVQPLNEREITLG